MLELFSCYLTADLTPFREFFLILYREAIQAKEVPTVDWILRQIRDQIGQVAKSSLKSYAPLAIADADNFLLGLEPDLTQWMGLH